MKVPKHVLPIIVFAQFCCTSLWFAGNAVLPQLIDKYHWAASSLGNLTSAVQFGFILGTLVFAILSLADRFSPSKLFFISAIFGALFNVLGLLVASNFIALLSFRFLVGFSLAGIYPVGMKIAADYYQKGLGKSLGYLVGALVIGTALPHLIKSVLGSELPWTWVFILTSAIAFLGGLLIVLFVGDGPHHQQMKGFDIKSISRIFKNKDLKSAAFGYFGHQWELYTFWAFVPLLITYHAQLHNTSVLNTSFYAFIIIGIGGLACVLAGYTSNYFGTKNTAGLALFLSGLCCLLSPLFLLWSSFPVFIAFLIFWGFNVVADSPLYSTLVAQNAEPSSKGTSLTLVNSIGFAITIVSIQLLSLLQTVIPPAFLFMILALGPAFGLRALYRK
ncbi:MAG: MFS transporter [Flavobacteriales bacterium]|jgi:MFS family permease|nr:MFS transporter [Flavobacteriales bacterium]